MQVFSNLRPIEQKLQPTQVSWNKETILVGDTISARVANATTTVLQNLGKELYNFGVKVANAGIFLWNKTVTWLNPETEVAAGLVAKQEAEVEANEVEAKPKDKVEQDAGFAASILEDENDHEFEEMVEFGVRSVMCQIKAAFPSCKKVAGIATLALGAVVVIGAGAQLYARPKGSYIYMNPFHFS